MIAGSLLWGSVCHHVAREASRFIPSTLHPNPARRAHHQDADALIVRVRGGHVGTHYQSASGRG